MKILSIGTNLGNLQKNLDEVTELLAERVNILGRSKTYITSAWGNENQDDFLNIALEIDIKLQAQEMLSYITEIEDKMGRQRTKKWAARIIDIDIMLWDDEIINTPNLQIPHSYLKERDFFLVPALDLNNDLVDPGSGKTFSALFNELSETDKTITGIL